MLFTCLYYSYCRSAERDRRLTEQAITLEKTRSEQLATELRLLRAQYHPHFLFNMLNTIYVQIDEDNEAPRHTIECLSEVLRYQLYSPDSPVDIADEIEVMEKFIELCRLRASRSLSLKIDIESPPHRKEYAYILSCSSRWLKTLSNMSAATTESVFHSGSPPQGCSV